MKDGLEFDEEEQMEKDSFSPLLGPPTPLSRARRLSQLSMPNSRIQNKRKPCEDDNKTKTQPGRKRLRKANKCLDSGKSIKKRSSSLMSVGHSRSGTRTLGFGNSHTGSLTKGKSSKEQASSHIFMSRNTSTKKHQPDAKREDSNTDKCSNRRDLDHEAEGNTEAFITAFSQSHHTDELAGGTRTTERKGSAELAHDTENDEDSSLTKEQRRFSAKEHRSGRRKKYIRGSPVLPNSINISETVFEALLSTPVNLLSSTLTTTPTTSIDINSSASKESITPVSRITAAASKTNAKKERDELEFFCEDDNQAVKGTNAGRFPCSHHGTETQPKVEGENTQQDAVPSMPLCLNSCHGAGRTCAARFKSKRQENESTDFLVAREQRKLSPTSSTHNSPRSSVLRFAHAFDKEDDVWTASSDNSEIRAARTRNSSGISSSFFSMSLRRRKQSRRRFPLATKTRSFSKTESTIEDKQGAGNEEVGAEQAGFRPFFGTSSTTPKEFTSATASAGVGVDVYDLQDHGHWRMLADEVAFLCDGLRRSSIPEFSDSATELAWIMSLEKNRHVLTNNPHGLDETVLNLLGELPFWIADKPTKEVDATDTHDNCLKEDHQGPSGNISYRGSKYLKNVMLVMWHFLSLDCTWSFSPTALDRARALRLAILSHDKALTGLVQLALLDHLPFLSTDKSTSGHEQPKNHKRRLVPSVPSTPESGGSYFAECSDFSADPTVAGRKRRRGSRPKASTFLAKPPPPLPNITEGKVRHCRDLQTSNGKVISDHKEAAPRNSNDVSFSAPPSPTKLADERVCSHDPLTHQAIRQEQWKTILKRAVGPVENTAHEGRVGFSGDATFASYLSAPVKGIADSTHSCREQESVGETEPQDQLPPNLALLALQRILTGRFEGHERSCLDDASSSRSAGNEQNFCRVVQEGQHDHDEESNNPLIVTNHILGSKQQRAIILLAKAMGQAVITATAEMCKSDENRCIPCADSLYERLSILASIIDGACLFHSKNRHYFCTACFEVDDSKRTSLIPILVGLLRSLLGKNISEGQGGWCPTSLFCGTTVSWKSGAALEVLKTLTSLTHENKDALSIFTKNNGWQVLCQLLFNHAGATSMPDRHDDLAIFALNALANLVESSLSSPELRSDAGCTALFANLHVVDIFKRRHANVLFLPWLVKHLVSLTDCFKDELSLNNSYSPSQQVPPSDQHFFEDRDRDNLLLSGNGFVLVAYVLVGSSLNSRLERVVLENLPGLTYSRKICFLQKALRAFCNFYRHIVGELSVAVTAPVESLLQVLQTKVRQQTNAFRAD